MDSSEPTRLGADVLVGTMPAVAFKDENLSRLTWKYEWKPMRVALTEDAIYLARQGEDILRDRIPLLEVVQVKRSNCVQGDEPQKNYARITRKSQRQTHPAVKFGSSLKSVASDIQNKNRDELHIIQIHTVQGGYNCGKVYHLNATSEQQREEWATALESTVAVALRRAAPHPLAPHQRRLKKLHCHRWFQSVIAVITRKFHRNISMLEPLKICDENR